MLILIGGAVSTSFLSAGNISNLLLQIAPLGIVAIGQTFVMIVRGLDLSVASMMATAAVIATGFAGSNDDVALIVAAVAGTSICVGLINGFLVARRGVSPFLATLATMILLQGFRFAYTVAAPKTISSEARATPAVPLLLTSSVRIIMICWPMVGCNPAAWTTKNNAND